MAKRLSMIFGVVFVIVGLLGYVPNPIVGPEGLFMTNGAHNMTHLLIGVLMIAAALASERASTLSMYIFGGLYAVLAMMGFAEIGSEGHTNLLGMVHINGADNWLHVALAIALIVSGLAASRVHRPVAHTP